MNRAASEQLEWTAWKPLERAPDFTPEALAELLDGGQAFRWHRLENGDWQGVWASFVVELSLRKKSLHWRVPEALKTGAATTIAQYLAIGSAQSETLENLPLRSDAHLARCVSAFLGLAILRQPFAETLLCFLCSATKQIVQIKQMVQLLAERHGADIVPGLHRLPTWTELAAVSETELRGCLLGFRARYIHQTAQFIANHAGWLEETATLSYAEAKARLCLLPGVGEKVADCVLLFGAGKLEAFPVDVWIIKTMERRYGLEGWKPAQIAHFGRVHFGAGAGLAQQFLFAFERQAARKSRGSV